jgi:hypothetical protein
MGEEVMEKPYPSNLRDLFSSDVRIRIFETVCLQHETFCAQDIVDELAKNGLIVRRTAVQNFLHILHIRNYLTGFEYRLTHRRGRLGMRYQRREVAIR